MSHTPGPWECTPSQIRDDLHWITRRSSCELTVKVEGSEANARLIAAAPDLLAAMEALVDWSLLRSDWLQAGQPHPENHPISKARAAIAKAKGEA